MGRMSRAACLSPLIFLLPGAVLAAPKCAPRPEGGEDLPEIAFVIDGEVVEGSALADPPDHIQHIEVACWDTVEKWLDIKVRTAAVIIYTKKGPARETEASLRTLVKTQKKYRERNGSYTDDLLSLSPYAPPQMVFVYLALSEDGWEARAENNDLHQVCYVFMGTPPDIWTPITPGPEPWLVEGEPVCL